MYLEEVDCDEVMG